MKVTLLAYTSVNGIPEPEKHGSAVFLIEGISRTCSHQIVRHRLASFSQESQRYVSLDKGGWEPVVPPKMAEDLAAQAILDEAWADLQDAYAKLRAQRIRKEDARFLLPNAAETKLVMSMAYPALRHFFWLRIDKAAQWEVQEVGKDMLRLVYPLAPTVFQDIWDFYMGDETPPTVRQFATLHGNDSSTQVDDRLQAPQSPNLFGKRPED